MSDAHPEHDVSHAAPHEGPIKTPKQLILAVVFAFLVPITLIVLLVHYVTAEHQPNAGSDAMSAEAVAQRIQPVGSVEVKDASDASTLKTGQQVFEAQCTTCHTAGMLGAPKFGDKAAWAPRIALGYNTLLNSALHGKNNMPAQGGGDFSDLEVARAVVYMANAGGASFPEPKAPAASPAQAASAVTAAASASGEGAAAQVAAALKSVQTASAGGSNNAGAAAAGSPPPLFTQVCSACHSTGAAGAPKVGDKAAWAPRITQGVDALVANAIKGKNAMPPKGGAANASDADIRAVVTYMVNQAK